MAGGLYSYTDPDGDKVAVFPANITGKGYDLGPGINIRTTFDGASIPDAEIPNLITALQRHLGDPDGWLWG